MSGPAGDGSSALQQLCEVLGFEVTAPDAQVLLDAADGQVQAAVNAYYEGQLPRLKSAASALPRSTAGGPAAAATGTPTGPAAAGKRGHGAASATQQPAAQAPITIDLLSDDNSHSDNSPQGAARPGKRLKADPDAPAAGSAGLGPGHAASSTGGRGAGSGKTAAGPSTRGGKAGGGGKAGKGVSNGKGGGGSVGQRSIASFFGGASGASGLPQAVSPVKAESTEPPVAAVTTVVLLDSPDQNPQTNTANNTQGAQAAPGGESAPDSAAQPGPNQAPAQQPGPTQSPAPSGKAAAPIASIFLQRKAAGNGAQGQTGGPSQATAAHPPAAAAGSGDGGTAVKQEGSASQQPGRQAAGGVQDSKTRVTFGVGGGGQGLAAAAAQTGPKYTPTAVTLPLHVYDPVSEYAVVFAHVRIRRKCSMQAAHLTRYVATMQ